MQVPACGWPFHDGSFLSCCRYDDGVASTAIHNLKRRGILKGKNQGKILQRDVPS